MQQSGFICAFTNSDSWVILSPIEQSIKRKIEAVGTPLKDWDIQINYGIKTGCNEAFIISTEKRKEILRNCQPGDERKRTDELIRPILRGRDIKRYGYNWAGWYLIATFPSRHYDIEQYPAVKNYLLSFGIERLEQTGKVHNVNGKKIKARKKTNNKWFETQDSISYWEDFYKPKIIYPNMTKYMPFVYDEANFLTNQKCFIITGQNMAYLTAFLNSSLFKYCFRDSFPELQGGTRELSKIFFDKIPVKQVSLEQNEKFRKIVNSVQSDYTIEQTKSIDTLLFDLYNLTTEERKVIGYVEIK
ncbi:putative type IIS restriction/modification enzyme [Hallella multisaccharivorax DSM 17128]|uniref:site-specific DNA-methyltransferase (adenine-specific) n=2 Tax=Hallella multisaccharivorax TaxID=310514 RepID=F8NAZ2_9BACT|nr:putative type IIS restriction/modification enzyme [Hallella multisaccharivorax DSM 17128]